MKIRNHKKREYIFYPIEENRQYFESKRFIFKYKSDLIKFLNKHLIHAVNGTVTLSESGFGYSGSIREWFVWYNERSLKHGNIQIELRQLDFRGRKFIHKKHIIGKRDKKYFAFSNKVINLMYYIEKEDGTIESKDAKKLVDLFYKRGFKDFEPTEEDWTYINGHIGVGIEFKYWCDRCNWLRTKTIIEYFKRKNLI